MMSTNPQTLFDLTLLTRLVKPGALGAVLLTSGLLTACGGSSSDTNEELQTETQVTVGDDQSANNSDDLGTLVLALTDAEEDFLSYTIGVNAIYLTRDNGDQIEILSDATEVDFVEYQELSELFSIGRLPAGRYQSVAMELDYSNAYILIQDEMGNSYEAQALDEEGQILTRHVVDFELAEGQELVIQPKRQSHLTLDLDLSSSNTIESFEPAVVRVEPFVVASVALDEEREHRLRGTVASVDPEAETLVLNVKPMRKKIGDFGQLQVSFDENASFDIDGASLSSSEALTNLSSQGETFPVVVYGRVEMSEEETGHSFIAERLLAGSSVPWSGKDVFKGVITALETGVPVINGLVIETDLPSRGQLQGARLVADATSTFANRGENFVDASYLVPGQRLETLGQWIQSDELTSFNVSGETVHIIASTLLGQVTAQTDAGVLTLDVERVNQRPGKIIKHIRPELTQETVTVDASGLSQLEIDTGDWVKVVGYFNPVLDDETHIDIAAKAVVKYEVGESSLNYKAVWGQEGGQPVLSAELDTLTVDTSKGRHKMNFRFNPVNVIPDLDSLQIRGAGDEGRFAIRARGMQPEFFASWVEFATALQPKLEQGTVSAIHAKGQVNEESHELEVSQLVVKLN